MNSIKRKPTHPGEIVKCDYLEPLNISITQLAHQLKVSRKTMSGIINERKPVTPDMALRLARVFNTTPGLWLNLQANYDLWQAAQNSSVWEEIEPLYPPEDEALEVSSAS